MNPRDLRMNLNIQRLSALAITLSAAAASAAPPDSPGAAAAPAPGVEADVLGQVPDSKGSPAITGTRAAAAAGKTGIEALDRDDGTAAPAPARRSPAGRPTPLADMPKGLGYDGAGRESGDTERIVFRRAPVRLVLPLNRERLVTFPGTFALHTPEGFETLVRATIIERTGYLTAIVPFGSVRIVAEDLATGRQIPIDLVADTKTKVSLPPVEVFVPGTATAAPGAAGTDPAPGTAAGRAATRAEPPLPPPLDMVGLTRYAAQHLYAPTRLIPAVAGVRQMPIATTPVAGLYRGWRVETTPIGAWRSGQLYVTAVRFTNQGQQAVDIDLQELRGQWLAATAQHKRLLAAGSDWGTTTVYLVCDRPFDACR